MEQQIHIYC